MLFLASAITPSIVGVNFEKYSNTINFHFGFSEPEIQEIEIDGEIYHRITMQELKNSYDYGKACLPIKSIKVLLPQGRDFNDIEIYGYDKITLESSYRVEVAGRVIPITSENKIIDDKKLSLEIDQSPDSLYSIQGVHSFRGFSILYVNIKPVFYNQISGEISYYKNIDVKITTKDCKINKAFRGLSKDFEIVKTMVDNPDYVNTYDSKLANELSQNHEYVIITNLDLKNSNEEYTFQDLADVKAAKGLNPIIVTVGEIILNSDYSVNGEWGDNNPSNPFYQNDVSQNTDLFDDKPAKIRNFIRYAYSEWGTDYVLLGGDADIVKTEDNIIPLRGLFANESGLPLNNSLSEEEEDIPSDVYYACLDGNFNYDMDEHFGESHDRNDAADLDEADLLSEVWVGRACADSDEEVSNFVKKTIEYEGTSDPYLSNIMFVGEFLGSAFYYPYGGYYKDDMEYLVPDSFNLDKFYDYDYPDGEWYPSDLVTEIYDFEPQIINHDGHGSCHYMLKMGSYSFYELENEKPFFIYSHSCLTGSFDNWDPWSGHQEDDCIAEILTCEIPYGAFACILNARYGLGSETSPEAPSGSYDESFYKALFTEGIKELGRANHYSKEDNVWRIDHNGYRWCYYQTNLFGDPELSIKNPNNPPNKPTISGPTNGIIGETYEYVVSTTDPDGDEIYYWIEWFDGCPNIYWQGPYQSGEEVTFDYTWDKKGTHTIIVKAKDSNDGISESTTLTVTMPKNKGRIDTIDLINRFSLIKHLFLLFF